MRQAGRDLKACFVNWIPVLLPFSICQSWDFQELESWKRCSQVSQCLGCGDVSVVEQLFVHWRAPMWSPHRSLQKIVPKEEEHNLVRSQLRCLAEQCELLLDMVCSNCVSLLRVTASPRGEGICLPRRGGESLFVFAVRWMPPPRSPCRTWAQGMPRTSRSGLLHVDCPSCIWVLPVGWRLLLPVRRECAGCEQTVSCVLVGSRGFTEEGLFAVYVVWP